MYIRICIYSQKLANIYRRFLYIIKNININLQFSQNDVRRQEMGIVIADNYNMLIILFSAR